MTENTTTVRYMIDDVAAAIEFDTRHTGLTVESES